jgi:ElaB/YqjD/DUF883 family membrane-anchored ribosome-binding protein
LSFCILSEKEDLMEQRVSGNQGASGQSGAQQGSPPSPTGSSPGITETAADYPRDMTAALGREKGAQAPQETETASGYPRDMTSALGKEKGESMAELARQAQATLDQAKRVFDQAKKVFAERTGEARQLVTERGQQACSAADTYVKESPWKAISLAALAGVLTGLLIGRR